MQLHSTNAHMITSKDNQLQDQNLSQPETQGQVVSHIVEGSPSLQSSRATRPQVFQLKDPTVTDSTYAPARSRNFKGLDLEPGNPQKPSTTHLPTSPSQWSIEKAIAQKFASLGIRQQPMWRTRMDRFVLNEGPRVLFLCIWTLLQLLVFYFSFEIYNRSIHYSQARANLGITLGVSRGAAAVINFDCSLILFSVCRNLISLLRSTFLNNIVPFDKNILFHKTVAWSIVFFSVVHSVSHYVNYYHLERVQQEGQVKRSAQYMAFLTGPGFTGHVLILVLFLMVTSSVERVRKKGFEMFWYTHHLFILFFLTLMSHGAFCFIHADTPPYCKSSPNSYKFVLGSLLLYILERAVREIRARLPTSISKIVLHPSKVVEVQIKKENKHSESYFRAKAGQYLFLNCPDISLFEWHPFTITSAPEEDYVSVHIRIVGDWTKAFARRLGCSFDDEQQFWIEEPKSQHRNEKTAPAAATMGSAAGSSSTVTLDTLSFAAGSLTGTKLPPHLSGTVNLDCLGMFKRSFYVQNPTCTVTHSWLTFIRIASSASILQMSTEAMTLPRVLVDGPYGSPSEDAFNYEIAVLVGAGIGVTPFASVLKHIWYSVMQPTKIITLRKAFEWFQDLLIALEEQNLVDFLEIRSYLTGELGADEMNTVLMEARASTTATATRHLRHKNLRMGRVEGDALESPGIFNDDQTVSNDSLIGTRNRDAITGLRSPTYYGRPNFDKIFGELAQAHPREHGEVGVFFCGPKPLGKTLNRCARKYKFEFHKENF
ncbi:hypothetical protein BG011_009095 [Mortierella polycephala]|uniref:FAD-binding FR-type domain-containing protein n=1 Tax=Mortierella polycephala TaxID=41804 RepID=A0A9P6PPT5_9FUNG|nr:hypothetical protein BG011_009095 [Mortierella polycephala]